MAIFNKIRPGKDGGKQFAVVLEAPPKPTFPRYNWGHLWVDHGREFKCLHCGGVVEVIPKDEPAAEWTPNKFELPLTDDERLRARAFIKEQEDKR